MPRAVRRSIVLAVVLVVAALIAAWVHHATLDCGQITDMNQCENTWGCTVSRAWHVALPGQPPPEQLHSLDCVRAGAR